MRQLTSIPAFAIGLALAASAASAPPSAPPTGTPSAPTASAPAARGIIGQRIAEAQEGDTLRIGPGVYREHIRVNKPIRLVADGNVIIDGGGSGDVVEVTAPGVEFRGFVVRNTGDDLDKENAAIRVLAARTTIENNVLEDVLFGIDLREAPDCIIRGNRIGGKALDIARRGDGLRLWRSDRALIENNAIHDGRDAILWYSTGVVVRGNSSGRCRYGLHLMYSDQVLIEDNVLTGNSVGIYLMYSKGVTLSRNRLLRNRGPSGYGIGLKEVDQFTVENNILAGNRAGVYLDGSPFSTVNPGVFRHNTFAYNDVGLTMLPSVRGNEFSENNFIDNTEQVCVLGRGELVGNSFSRGSRGNFWTDYVGYDQDRNGVGDFVHESRTLFESMLDREPKLRLFLFSPAQQAVEFVGRALPAVRPEAKFTDEFPLMQPVPIDVGAVPAPPASGALAGVGACLLGIGVGALSLARPIGRPGPARRNGALP